MLEQVVLARAVRIAGGACRIVRACRVKPVANTCPPTSWIRPRRLSKANRLPTPKTQPPSPSLFYPGLREGA